MAHRPVARSHEPVRYLHKCKKKKKSKKKRKAKKIEGKRKNKTKSKKYEHPRLCSRSRTPSTNLVYVMYAFPSDIGDICQSILVQNGQASHVREYVHRVSSNWSLHAPPVPFSIFVPNTYPILPFKRVITSFSEGRAPIISVRPCSN